MMENTTVFLLLGAANEEQVLTSVYTNPLLAYNILKLALAFKFIIYTK